MECDNLFRSRTIAILINDTMTKYLDHVSCADCILDISFPSHESTTTNNCNPIFGQIFGILFEHNNVATFHARTVINCELMHLYSINTKPIDLRTNSQHSSSIIDKLLPFEFPWHMRKNLTNYLLAKLGISDFPTYMLPEKL